MANYVKSTSFALKDSLPDTDPLKIVRGTEIDDEFNNIAIAVATKADSNNTALTGIPTAPTLAATAETTQVANAAFVQAAIRRMYPVGSIYINAADATNPATLFGFGTWVEFGSGRVMIGQDAADPLFDTLQETGGSKDAIVVSHTHSVNDPGHAHAPPSGLSAPYLSNAFSGDGSIDSSMVTGPTERNPTTGNTASATTGITINSTGSSGTNANLQPYVVVKMWRRTA